MSNPLVYIPAINEIKQLTHQSDEKEYLFSMIIIPMALFSLYC